jgi:hypothetical protein
MFNRQGRPLHQEARGCGPTPVGSPHRQIPSSKTSATTGLINTVTRQVNRPKPHVRYRDLSGDSDESSIASSHFRPSSKWFLDGHSSLLLHAHPTFNLGQLPLPKSFRHPRQIFGLTLLMPDINSSRLQKQHASTAALFQPSRACLDRTPFPK